MIANQDIITKWTAAIESGNYPDMTLLGVQDVGDFAQKALLRDLSDLMDRIQEENGAMFPRVKDVMTADGKLYTITHHVAAQSLIYRKDMLQAAGWNEPPATWEEYRQMDKDVTDASQGIYGAGIGYGLKNSAAEWTTRHVLFSYGASVCTEDGKGVALHSPEARQAIELLAGIATDGSMPPSAVNWDDTGNNKAFLTSQVATAFHSATLYLSAMDDPELSKVNETGSDPQRSRRQPDHCRVYGIWYFCGRQEF